MKLFLEEMSDQTIEITPYQVAYYYVAYCKQNKVNVKECKIHNYIQRMKLPLISDKIKAEFKNLFFTQAVRYGKYYQNNS